MPFLSVVRLRDRFIHVLRMQTTGPRNSRPCLVIRSEQALSYGEAEGREDGGQGGERDVDDDAQGVSFQGS